jgi:tetratricopeptide (TPR) repeat protein
MAFSTRMKTFATLRVPPAAALAFALFAVPCRGQLDPKSLVPIYRQALAEREQQFGPEHPKVARSASDLGLYLRNIGEREAAAEPLARALAIDRRTLQPDDPLLCEDEENLASVLPPAQAVDHYLQAANCKHSAISARAWGKAGDLLSSLGDRKAAVKCYQAALRQEETASGPDGPRVAVRLNDLVQVTEPRQAETLARRALAIERKTLGPDHPATAVTLNNLANVLAALRRFGEAETFSRRSVQVLEKTLGPDHPRVAVALSTLAGILMGRREFAGARALYERALRIDEAAYGPNHPEVAADLGNLADALAAAGQNAKAAQIRGRAAEISGARPE